MYLYLSVLVHLVACYICIDVLLSGHEVLSEPFDAQSGANGASGVSDAGSFVLSETAL